MKAIFIVTAIAAVGLLGYYLISSDSGSDQAYESSANPTAPQGEKSPPPSATLTDPLKVFRSAFWRSPSAGDEILDAERREVKRALLRARCLGLVGASAAAQDVDAMRALLLAREAARIEISG